MPLPERMKRVTELYDSYSWGKNGVFTKRDSENVCEYNITKNDIFYLKKKKKGKKQYEDR